ATAVKIPEAWKKQLKVGGRIVAPMNSSIWLFVKKAEGVFEEKKYPGFVFVPLIAK
ncbi:MAG: protein-L-isoaspartate O-methyltransferase, partial [Candidatus Pacebacteria bacterium]|nr:protein-L-isoaspartate O-methyltransferase [Candidatus Paceibacterota bacterium]